MAVILAGMPDLWQRLLVEHSPDPYGRCQECRTAAGVAAVWPCLTRRIAEDAQALHEGHGLSRHARVPLPREAEAAGRHGVRHSPAADYGRQT